MEENKLNDLEIWKDIPNYEGLYQASNLGNIRTLVFHNNVCFKKRIHILKQQIDKYGRKRVILTKNGNIKAFQTHTLIAITFLDKTIFKSMPNENKNLINLDTLEINHKDENPLNNNVSNLEWCTHSYNMHYGNIEIKKAIGKGYKKINQYDINGNFIKQWNNAIDIKNELNISKQSISYCCNNKTKTAGGYIWRYVNE